jgi:hypothetical protein
VLISSGSGNNKKKQKKTNPVATAPSALWLRLKQILRFVFTWLYDSKVHIQNDKRQNVELQNVEIQNVNETKRQHIKTSTITKRRQLQNVEFFCYYKLYTVINIVL